MTADIIEIQESALERYDITDQRIQELKEKYKDAIDYDIVKSGVAEIRSLKSHVESTRKELKADALKWGKIVDSEAKRIKSALDEIDEPMKLIKKAVEDEKEEKRLAKKQMEQSRIDDIRSRLNQMRGLTHEAYTWDDIKIKKVVGDLKASILTDDNSFGEFSKEADETRDKAITTLEEMLLQRKHAREQDDQMRKQKEKMADEWASVAKEKAEMRKKQEDLKAKEDKISHDEERKQIEVAAKENAEREAKEKIEADKAEKKQAEEEAKLKAARAPDLEKIVVFGNSLFTALDKAPKLKDKNLSKQFFVQLTLIENLASAMVEGKL